MSISPFIRRYSLCLRLQTFRPRKKFPHGTIRYSLHKQACASLNSGLNLRSAVKLPPGEDPNDWVAVHGKSEPDLSLNRNHLKIFLIVVDFFNRINLIYGTISENCSESSCPTMSGGPRFEYLWADGDKFVVILYLRLFIFNVRFCRFKKPTALPAKEYVSNLMDWIEAQINNQNLFPCTSDLPFPKGFLSLCSKILARLHRVFVHVYIHHFQNIVSIAAVSLL